MQQQQRNIFTLCEIEANFQFGRFSVCAAVRFRSSSPGVISKAEEEKADPKSSDPR